MAETKESELIRGALIELLSAVTDLARIADSVADGHADLMYVRSAIEEAARHIAALAPQQDGRT